MKKYGFLKLAEHSLPDISSTAVEYRHEKTGARLLHIDREDKNKTFMIGFKTPPTDSTGVFHIIEHSVLSGSKKYPLKEPFVELLKGSLNTFLNAMTYPDKTVYPVSSMNDKDFCNLVSVYMDAVFNPEFLENELIFMQEGHRLTQKDGVPEENGVVLNEMLGAYSSPEEIEMEKMMELLYPGTPYAFSSGGAPKAIPELTYEGFVSTYKKHYSPAGAYIVLDGAVKLDEILPLIDGYLSEAECAPTNIQIPPSPMPRGVRVSVPYPIGKEETASGKTRITLGMRAFSFDERERNIALAVVREAIASTSSSPLVRAVLDTGLCSDVYVTPIEEMREGAMTVTLVNVKDGAADELVELVMKKLREFAADGIPTAALDAALTSIEFAVREKNYGSLPIGVVNALAVMESWLYSDNCIQNLSYNDVFAALREKIGTDYYRRVLGEVIPSDEDLVVLTLVADGEYSERLDARYAERARAAWEKLGEDGRARQEELCAALDKRQSAPDSPEALATLPRLSAADISRVPDIAPASHTEIMGVPVSSFDIKTSGIIYINAYFDISDLSPDECVDVSVLASALTRFSTENYDEGELGIYVKSNLGYFNAAPLAYLSEDGKARAAIKLSVGLLPSGLGELSKIVGEVLTRTRFETKDVKKLLSHIVVASRENMCADGTAVALDRAHARVSAVGAINEYFNGYEAYSKISAWENDGEAISLLSKRLEALLGRVFVKERVRLFTAGDVATDALEELVSVLCSADTKGAPYPHKPLGALSEGIELPVASSFTALGFDIPADLFSGAYKTVRTMLRYEYLWSEIRAKGGAYGAGHTQRSDFIAFSSFRDPTPARSIETYLSAPDFLEEFVKTLSDEELEKYIIGTFSTIDGVRAPRLAFDVECARQLRGLSYERLERERRETLETTRGDVLEYARLLRERLPHAVSCTVASGDTLAAMGNKIDKVNKVG